MLAGPIIIKLSQQSSISRLISGLTVVPHLESVGRSYYHFYLRPQDENPLRQLYLAQRAGLRRECYRLLGAVRSISTLVILDKYL